nr:hypothetical protein GCM10020093_049320 [Planobispora longispora]
MLRRAERDWVNALIGELREGTFDGLDHWRVWHERCAAGLDPLLPGEPVRDPAARGRATERLGVWASGRLGVWASGRLGRQRVPEIRVIHVIDLIKGEPVRPKRSRPPGGSV